MAIVNGMIGDQQVNLENAATEATLKLLLQATLASTKEEKEAVAKMIEKAGLSPKTVEKTHVELTNLEKKAAKLGGAYAGLEYATNVLKERLLSVSNFAQTMISGSGQASNFFGTFAKFSGPVGLVATGFQLVASAQEAMLRSYQEMSGVGVNFGGSLTLMKIQTQAMGLTMDEFTALVKKNSEAMYKMGGGVSDNADAFTKLSMAMYRSDVRGNLQALGYTTAQINQGMIDYIATTGGRTKAEMANTTALIKNSSEYLTELDLLAQVTGKSREQQEEQLKEQTKNAAYQNYLSTLDEEGKKRANERMAAALAKGGKGAADALMYKIMGMPPLTKEAQMFTAMGGKAVNAIDQMANGIKNGTGNVDREIAELTFGLAERGAQLGNQLGSALIATGGEIGNFTSLSLAAQTELRNKGIKSQTDYENYLAELRKKQLQKDKEVKDAADAQVEINRLGQQLLQDLIPLFRALQPHLTAFIKGLISVLEIFKPEMLLGIGLGLSAFWTALKMYTGYKIVGSLIANAVTAGVTAAAPTAAAGVGGLETAAAATTGATMFSKAAPFLKKAGGVAGAGLGAYDAYREINSGKYLAGTLSALGSTAFVAGLAADATGIGAIGGIPLNIIGAGLVGVGKIVDWMSDDDKKEADESKKDNNNVEDPDANKRLIDELKRLNTISENMLHTMQSVSYDIKRSVSAINGLKPGLYPTS